jgi:FixJ family two-component response regulator
MPGLSGLDLQRELQNGKRMLPIVFLTGHGNIPMGVNAMKAGAVDFLPKPVQEKVLLGAIEQALVRSAQEAAENIKIANIQRRINSLAPRELEAMKLLTQEC